jgi:hypothetical protein
MDATHMAAFGRLLDTLGRVYRRPLASDEKAAYLLALDDQPYEAILYACKQVLREETFMPVPAILRSYAKDWCQRQRQEVHRRGSSEDALALREKLVTTAEVRALIASVWPEERDR